MAALFLGPLGFPPTSRRGQGIAERRCASSLPGRRSADCGLALRPCASHQWRAPTTMLLNGRPKSKRPKLRKGYKPPRLTRQLRWGIEDLEEHIMAERYSHAYTTYVNITKLDIVPELSQYHEMILLMGLMGVGEAELVVEDMRKREVPVGIATWNEMIKVHGRKRDPEGMVMTLKRIDRLGVEVNGATFWALVEGFVKSNDPDGAQWAIEEMKRRKATRDVGSFLSRMRCYSFLGDVDSVEDAFFEMTEKYGHAPTPYAYNLRIASFASKGEAFAAEETLREMTGPSRLKANEMTYDLLIKMYVTMRDLDRAKSSFQRMKDAKLKPSNHSFSELMRGFKEKEDAEAIEEAMMDMKRHRSKVSGFRNNFNTIARIQSSADAYSGAFAALKRLLKYDINPRAETYISIFAPAVTNDLLQAPETVVEKMSRTGIDLDRFFSCCLFDAYLRLEQPQYALSLLDLMLQDGRPASSGMLSVLVGSYCRRGNPEAAMSWLHYLLSLGIRPNPKAFAYVAGAFSRRLDERKTRALLGMMRQHKIRWHPRQRQCLHDARARDPTYLSHLVLIRQPSELVPDRQAGFEFSQRIQLQSKRRSPNDTDSNEETSGMEDDVSDFHARDGDTGGYVEDAGEGAQCKKDLQILEDVLPEIQVDRTQHLIMARLTELAELTLNQVTAKTRSALEQVS